MMMAMCWGKVLMGRGVDKRQFSEKSWYFYTDLGVPHLTSTHVFQRIGIGVEHDLI
jgi:hypothetical protein